MLHSVASSFELFDEESTTRTGTRSEMPPHTKLKTRLSGVLPPSLRDPNSQPAPPAKGLVDVIRPYPSLFAVQQQTSAVTE